MLKLHNTLSRKKEAFKPIKDRAVGLYTCGPTVYWFAHIGNLRTYLFEDLLKRVLVYNGYRVKHVMNITDVGHLTSDADTGEDKLEKGAQREQKTVWEIADFYTKNFQNDLKKLNIKEPDVWLKATETIKEQIELIQTLEQKGFAYKIEDGVYFGTSKLKEYGQLWGSKKPVELKAGARVEVVEGKKNPSDFALWKLTPPDVKRQMEWNSPWGKGFPGWHTECVVMSIKELGIPFDIHCGGIDHIQIHHTNEIAQAEAAYDKALANFWLHGDFLIEKDGKMSKSKGEILTLEFLTKKGFNPLAYRYLCLTTHYRSKLTFSWESLEASQKALNNLYKKTAELKAELNFNSQPRVQCSNTEPQNIDKGKYRESFNEFINNDLDIPQALALAWKMLDDNELSAAEKYALLLDFDGIFGLNFDKIERASIPQEIIELAGKREELRKQKRWSEADLARAEIKNKGYVLEDADKGPLIKKIN